MNRTLLAVMVVASLLDGCSQTRDAPASQATLTDQDFGMALERGGVVYVCTANQGVKAGSPVELVNAAVPQSIASGSVTGSADISCRKLGLAGEKAWIVKVGDGHLESNAEAIAILGSPKLRVRQDRVESDGPAKVTFRSCESSEGIHLTAWRGAPLQGARIWHGYHHLDQGLEATCTDSDTKY